jgi:outer membrane protein OmpA-like peptidoglycan-associated protein
MTTHAPSSPPARARRAALAVCLTLGLADLGFINVVALPKALGARPRAVSAPAPTPRIVLAPLPPSAAPETPGPATPGPGVAPAVAQQSAPSDLPEPEPAPAPATLSRPIVIVRFPSGGAALDARARQTLEALVARTSQHPDWTLTLEGHADQRGDVDINERLSLQRARTVARWLHGQGVPLARLQAAGFGATRPLADGDDPGSLRRNRRVEIRIEGGGP